MHLKIALLAGDGIGPEVIKEAVKVSNVIAEKYNHTMELIRTIVPLVVLCLQIYILVKLI